MKKLLLLKIVIAGLYLIPLSIFLFWQTYVHPFVTVKMYAFTVLVEATFGVWLFLITFHKEYRLRRSIMTLAVGLWLVILLFTSLIGYSVHRSFWSTPDRGIGLYALFHFFALFLILASLKGNFNWRRYINYLFWVSAVVSLLVILEKADPEFFLYGGGRPGSTLGNPSYLASYLIFGIFLGFWLIVSKWKEWRLDTKILFLGVTAFQIGILFLTDTRGAIVGLATGLVVLLGFLAYQSYRSNRSYGRIFKNIPLLILIGLILFGGIFFATRRSEFWQEVPGLGRIATLTIGEGGANNRLVAWKVAWTVFKEKPIFGWGFENFKYAFDFHYDPSLLKTGFTETYWDKPHNIILEMLVAGGVLGLLSYFFLLGAVFWVMVRFAPRKFLPFGIALGFAYLTQNLFVFDTFGSYLMFFVTLAFVDSFVPRFAARQSAGLTGEAAPAPIASPVTDRSRPILLIPGILCVGLIYLVFLNTKIIRANHYWYWGLNYYLNRLPDQALNSYRAGLAINEPYLNEVRQSYISALQQVIPQMKISNVGQDIELALKEFDKAIKDDPKLYFYRTLRGEARTAFYAVDPKFLDGAEGDVAEAERLSPNRQQNYYLAAKVKYLRDDPAGAVEEMKKAVDLDPSVGDPHFYYGLLLFQIQKLDDGVQEILLAKKLGREPKNVTELKILGDGFADSGHYDEAIAYYNGAVGLSERNDFDALLKLSLTYYYAGNRLEARNKFDEFLANVPNLKQSAIYPKLLPILEDLGYKDL